MPSDAMDHVDPKEVDPKKKEKKLAKIGTMKHRCDICEAPYNDVPNKQGSALKVIMGYAANECVAFTIGMISLVGG
jgi:hypothetical protein